MRIIEHIANLSVLFRFLSEADNSPNNIDMLKQQQKQFVGGISILDNYIDNQSNNNLIEQTINDMSVAIRNIAETISNIARRNNTGIPNEILYSIACLSKLVVDARDLFDEQQNNNAEQLVSNQTSTTLSNNQTSWKQNSTY